MDWVDQFMQFWGPVLAIFGILGLTAAFLLLVRCFRAHRYVPGLLFACLELLSAVPPTLAWMDALWNSGKRDWFLLGLLGYTPIALCFYAMFIAGAVCLILNIRGIVRGKRPEGPAPKTKADGEETSEK